MLFFQKVEMADSSFRARINAKFRRAPSLFVKNPIVEIPRPAEKRQLSIAVNQREKTLQDKNCTKSTVNGGCSTKDQLVPCREFSYLSLTPCFEE